MRAVKVKVVFAPAGSGKTEQLSRHYLELVKEGTRPERILTLTFTEKAASEMKERILNNAKREHPELYHYLRENILRLRISTIHSFCFSLLRRFSPLLGLDPHLNVVSDPENIWLQAKYDTLMKIAEEGANSVHYRRLISLLTSKHTNSWRELSRLLDQLFAHRTALSRGRMGPPNLGELKELACELRRMKLPRSLTMTKELFPDRFDEEMVKQVYRLLREEDESSFLTKSGTPRKQGFTEEERDWAERMSHYRNQIYTAYDRYLFQHQFELFREFLKSYNQAKQERGEIDYEDMELLALQLLHQHPEWQNILYAFDEHTDHILIDEFQDTSFLQWGIIWKLTEEWRAGQGVKSELNKQPSVFIVGDEKQSIYLFRGAKVEVFKNAATAFQKWLGPPPPGQSSAEGCGVETVSLKANYRSLSAIIDFCNTLFGKLMSTSGDAPLWQTRYLPFQKERKNENPGRVEIILDRFEGPLSELRRRDGFNVARRIQSLITQGYQVFDRQADQTETPRRCEYKDIAILIRARSQLPAIEQALRQANIPFLVVGGTGFYEEKEVRYLTALLSFLVDPADDTALYLTLRGPLFNIPERELFLVATAGKGDTLWQRLTAQRLTPDTTTEMQNALTLLSSALNQVHYQPLHLILDRILTETKAWQVFWEPQREAQVKKFLQLIQEKEVEGNHPLRIKNFLEKPGSDEPKADVPTEGLNAVQVMTVHSAKGLQFPIVFHPGLHEPLRLKRGKGEELLIEEVAPEEVVLSYISDKNARKESELHTQYEKKELEEEKRIFYVACTRACDALFLSGVWSVPRKEATKLDWLVEHLGLQLVEDHFEVKTKIPNLFCYPSTEIPEITLPAEMKEEKPPIIKRAPVSPTATPLVRSITRYTPQDRHRARGEYIALGEVIHQLLYLFSSGRVQPLRWEEELPRLFRINHIPKDRQERCRKEITRQIQRLLHSSIWEIIKPQENSFAELPIMFNDTKTIWTGRIDRLIVTPAEVRIYDYKTFPVKRSEIPRLKADYYSGQLSYYTRAVQELYPEKVVKPFLIFTHIPLLVSAVPGNS